MVGASQRNGVALAFHASGLHKVVGGYNLFTAAKYDRRQALSSLLDANTEVVVSHTEVVACILVVSLSWRSADAADFCMRQLSRSTFVDLLDDSVLLEAAFSQGDIWQASVVLDRLFDLQASGVLDNLVNILDRALAIAVRCKHMELAVLLTNARGAAAGDDKERAEFHNRTLTFIRRRTSDSSDGGASPHRVLSFDKRARRAIPVAKDHARIEPVPVIEAFATWHGPRDHGDRVQILPWPTRTEVRAARHCAASELTMFSA